MCNFNGYVLVSMSAYIRTTTEGTIQIFLNQNGTDMMSVGRNTGINGQLSMTPFLISVSNGDAIKMMARTWGDSYSFTLSANSMTYMTVQKVVSVS